MMTWRSSLESEVVTASGVILSPTMKSSSPGYARLTAPTMSGKSAPAAARSTKILLGDERDLRRRLHLHDVAQAPVELDRARGHLRRDHALELREPLHAQVMRGPVAGQQRV